MSTSTLLGFPWRQYPTHLIDANARNGATPFAPEPSTGTSATSVTAPDGDQARSLGSVLAPQSRIARRSRRPADKPGGQRGQGRGGAVLDNDAAVVPQQPSGSDDRLISDEDATHTDADRHVVGDAAEATRAQGVAGGICATGALVFGAEFVQDAFLWSIESITSLYLRAASRSRAAALSWVF
jgi:hypothetical protein